MISQMRDLRAWAGEHGVSPEHLEVLLSRLDPVSDDRASGTSIPTPDGSEANKPLGHET